MSEPIFDISWDDVKANKNVNKHKITFAQAATVMLDLLALTVFDAAHSQTEERWFTLGVTDEGRLLAVSHTYEFVDNQHIKVGLISAREATPHERKTYETTQH
jgi:uncharacterized protein